jgi:RNA recognition motif. (a.k.a. RRM, RBD, or RNP domain)
MTVTARKRRSLWLRSRQEYGGATLHMHLYDRRLRHTYRRAGARCCCAAATATPLPPLPPPPPPLSTSSPLWQRDLLPMFDQYGRVLDFTLPDARGTRSGLPHAGYGFVQLSRPADARDACRDLDG